MTIPITGLDLIGEIFLLSSSPLLWAWKAVSPLSDTSQWKRIVSWSKRDGGGIGRRQIARPTSHAPADLDGAHPAVAFTPFLETKKQNKKNFLHIQALYILILCPPFYNLLDLLLITCNHVTLLISLMQNRSRK